jgi:RNA polymerase sigma-70 factor (ECF subfamily)
VYRTLATVLGADDDLPDLLQEVFMRALDGIKQLRDAERVRGWLTSIAIFVARAHVRLRSRRRWLRVFSPERTHPSTLEQPSLDVRRALREVYAVLDEMPVGERLAFVLRFVDGMTLTDAAEACATSLATFKRRLARGQRLFLAAARQRPLLELWLEKGARWNVRMQS